MSKGLIIVESPAKANTIAKFLKNKYTVKASMGHVRDLPQRELGVDVAHDFEPVYVMTDKQKKVINGLKEDVKGVDTVLLASDHDREGEAIAWHLLKSMEKQLEGKQVHRIVFNEITAKAINSAIDARGEIDMNKVDAQQARRVLDRLVGYQVSPLLWRVIAKDLSAGRVQSVALRLICEREAEINNFIPKEYWRLEANFWRGELPPFKAVLEKWQGKKLEIESEEQALELKTNCEKHSAVLTQIKRSSRGVEPPAPFITSTLQQEASKLLGMPASRTMSIAQQLYEGIELGGESTGLITYMRTDSTRISSDANQACRNLIKDRFGEEMINSSVRMYKNKNSAQDAHEAIRPTDPFNTPEKMEKFLSKDQLKLYNLIWSRFVATQMQSVRLAVTKAEITLGDATFVANGNQITREGFLKCYPHVNIPLGESIHADYASSNELEHDAIDASQHFTKPPARYTEASLIKELEARGIGRPSTYASIIGTIRNRKYVQMEKKAFVPTNLGNDVNRFLVDKFDDVFNVKFTANMEEKLDEVEYGKVEWRSLVKDYHDQLQQLISAVDVKKEKSAYVQDSGIACDVCGEGKMLVRHSKNGEFLACDRFPACKNSKNFKRDADGKIHIVLPTQLDEACPQCGAPLMEREGRYGAFIACSAYPKCKFSRPKTLGVKCPDCGTGEVVQRRNKRGRNFYSCNRYPDCKWISNDKPVAIACPNCGNPFMFEKYSKAKGNHKLCPKCKSSFE